MGILITDLLEQGEFLVIGAIVAAFLVLRWVINWMNARFGEVVVSAGDGPPHPGPAEDIEARKARLAASLAEMKLRG